MKLFKKKMLAYAEPVTIDNLENLNLMGAHVEHYNEASCDAFARYANVGDTVIWLTAEPYSLKEDGAIHSAQCKTIEGLHTAELPSRLMKSANGGHPYFCTEAVFQETYEDAGQRMPINSDDLTDYMHQGSDAPQTPAAPVSDTTKTIADLDELFKQYDSDYEMFPLPICMNEDDERKELAIRKRKIETFIAKYDGTKLASPPVETLVLPIHSLRLNEADEFGKKFNYVSDLYRNWQQAPEGEEKEAAWNEYYSAKYSLEQGLPITVPEGNAQA